MCQTTTNTCATRANAPRGAARQQQQLQQQQQGKLTTLAGRDPSTQGETRGQREQGFLDFLQATQPRDRQARQNLAGAAMPALRKGGGQPGHPKHSRTPFTPEELATAGAGIPTGYATRLPDRWQTWLFLPTNCRAYVQQIEIIQPPLEISEHRALPILVPSLPLSSFRLFVSGDIELGGLLGPRLTCFLNRLPRAGFCHASYSTDSHLVFKRGAQNQKSRRKWHAEQGHRQGHRCPRRTL